MKVHNPNKLPTVKIADLIPTQGNLKDLTRKNYQKLKNNIERRGFIDPVAVWEDDKGIKYLLNGHQRQRVLTNEGWDEPIPYFNVPAKDLQEAAAIVLELTSQFGEITQEGLDEMIAKYELPEAEVYEATHFDALVFGEEEDEAPGIVEDEAPEVAGEDEEAISERGKVYELGRHRLMCGSATEQDDLKALLRSAPIDLVYTDPPYGVTYVSPSQAQHGKWEILENDEIRGGSLYEFTRDAIAFIKERLTDNAAIYCWYDDRHRKTIQQALEDAGLEYKQNLIWNKGMVLSGADYQKAHENVLYMQVAGGKAKWFGERNKKTILGQFRTDLNELKKADLIKAILNMQDQSTVWNIDRDSVLTYEHPTQKPVRLAARAILNSSKEDDTVYDGFAGSGSTLMACEQTDRECYAMELDPKFVDVIRKRWAKFTAPDNEVPENWQELTPEAK